MKFAFLILVHRDADMVIKLIDALLNYPGSSVFIHVDLKSKPLHEELNAKFKINPRVTIISERYKVEWGSYAQIKATLALMNATSSLKFDYACLLSGQDFPIKPVSDIANFLKQNYGKQYLVNFKLPDAQWASGGLNRMAYYHVDGFKRYWLLTKLEGLMERIHKITGYRRKLLPNLYGGSNWFNLTADAIKFVCDYVSQNPDYLKSFKYTLCADEIFVQTILMNSDFKNAVVSNDLRLTDWSTGPEFPRIWRIDDFERLVNTQQKYFARKFDSSVDAEIINKLCDDVGKTS